MTHMISCSTRKENDDANYENSFLGTVVFVSLLKMQGLAKPFSLLLLSIFVLQVTCEYVQWDMNR